MTPDETLREMSTCMTDWPGFLANKNTSCAKRSCVAELRSKYRKENQLADS